MDSEHKSLVRKKKHALAEDYAREYDSRFESPYPLARDNLILKPLILRIDEHQFVLDYGCGTGRCTFPLICRGIFTVSVDISKSMLSICKRKDPGKLMNLILCDGENLPFKSHAFDFVFSWSVLHHLSDVRKALEEISRVLKNSGTFYALEDRDTPLQSFNDVFPPALKSLIPILPHVETPSRADDQLSGPCHPGKKQLTKINLNQMSQHSRLAIKTSDIHFPLLPFRTLKRIRNHYWLSVILIKFCILCGRFHPFKGKGKIFMIEAKPRAKYPH